MPGNALRREVDGKVAIHSLRMQYGLIVESGDDPLKVLREQVALEIRARPELARLCPECRELFGWMVKEHENPRKSCPFCDETVCETAQRLDTKALNASTRAELARVHTRRVSKEQDAQYERALFYFTVNRLRIYRELEYRNWKQYLVENSDLSNTHVAHLINLIDIGFTAEDFKTIGQSQLIEVIKAPLQVEEREKLLTHIQSSAQPITVREVELKANEMLESRLLATNQRPIPDTDSVEDDSEDKSVDTISTSNEMQTPSQTVVLTINTSRDGVVLNTRDHLLDGEETANFDPETSFWDIDAGELYALRFEPEMSKERIVGLRVTPVPYDDEVDE